MKKTLAALLLVAAAVPCLAGQSSETESKPALHALFMQAGVQDASRLPAAPLAKASPAGLTLVKGRPAQIFFQCQAYPFGFGFGGDLMGAQWQACGQCSSLNRGGLCRYSCIERIDNIQIPVGSGVCN